MAESPNPISLDILSQLMESSPEAAGPSQVTAPTQQEEEEVAPTQFDGETPSTRHQDLCAEHRERNQAVSTRRPVESTDESTNLRRSLKMSLGTPEKRDVAPGNAESTTETLAVASTNPDLASGEADSTCGTPSFNFTSATLQEVLAVYHMFLLARKAADKETAQQFKSLEGVFLRPFLHQMCQGLMEEYHHYQRDHRRALVHLPPQVDSIQQILGTQEVNSLPAGLPEPLPLRPLHNHGVVVHRRPAAVLKKPSQFRGKHQGMFVIPKP